MTIFGYHASHEQLPPSGLLANVRLAGEAGFQAAMCSDHFAPWSRTQGHSGFAWSWLGAAMQATGLPFGCVNAPGQRYHPAILAPAGAPPALLAGETVSHRGLVTVDRAKLWSRPAAPPPLIGAAVSPETAGWVAGWADGLITVNQPAQRLRRVVDAFRAGGGAANPMYLQGHLAHPPDAAAALARSHQQWGSNVLDGSLAWELELPEQFEAAARAARADDARGAGGGSAPPSRPAGG